MKIELRKISQAGNNTIAELFFDGVRVTPHGIHCTPHEFDQFAAALQGGAVLNAFEEVVVRSET